MTKTRLLFLFSLVLMLALAACSEASTPENDTATPANSSEPTATPIPTQITEPPAPTRTEPAPQATPEQSEPTESESGEALSGYEVNLYKDNGLWLFYPPGAERLSTENGFAIVGPSVAVKSPDVDWVYNGPAYTLNVATLENQEGLDIETWTQRFLLDAWQQAKESGSTPPELYPVTEDGRLIEEALQMTTVRGQPAILVENAAFDFVSLSYYVPCGPQVAVLSFSFDDEPAAGTHPLFLMQQDIYTLLKDGFWCNADAMPSLLEALDQADMLLPQGDESFYRLNVYLEENGTFGLAYPPGAQVVPAKDGSGVTILGPEMSVRPADGDWMVSGPAYALDIAMFEMDDTSVGYEAETWARDYLLNLWQEEQAQGMPTGSLPVSEDGVIDESRVGLTHINGEPAFWVQYNNFDSNYRAFYMRCADRIVQVGFREEIPPNHPLADVQRDVYSLILNTFECVPPISMPEQSPTGEMETLPTKMVVPPNGANSGSVALDSAQPNGSASYLVGDDDQNGYWGTFLDFGMNDIQPPTVHAAYLDMTCAPLNGDLFTDLGGIDVFEVVYERYAPEQLEDPANIAVIKYRGTITECTPEALDLTVSLQQYFAEAVGTRPYQLMLVPSLATDNDNAEDMVEITSVQLMMDASP